MTFDLALRLLAFCTSFVFFMWMYWVRPVRRENTLLRLYQHALRSERLLMAKALRAEQERDLASVNKFIMKTRAVQELLGVLDTIDYTQQPLRKAFEAVFKANIDQAIEKAGS